MSDDKMTVSWAHVEGAIGYDVYTPVPKYRELVGWRWLWARIRHKPTLIHDGYRQHHLAYVSAPVPVEPTPEEGA